MSPLRYVISTMLLALMAGAGTPPALAGDEPARKIAFSIPEQPLGDALRQFGEQTGLQVVLYSDIGRGLKASKVSGNLTPRDALSRLLANTGLKYEYLNAQTVAISSGARKEAGSVLSPAGQLMLAQAGEISDPARVVVDPGGIEAAEVVVKSQRDRIGGNIDKTRTMNDIQPYYIYDSEFIQQSGALDAEDFLKMYVTMNTVMFTVDQGQGGDGTSGATSTVVGPSASNVNLNGLGAVNTLVLIDGRRQGAVNAAGQVDLSTLPAGSIERIEILPASASALYGASAMGGVVNVITRNNYKGGMVTAKYDQSEGANDARKEGNLSYTWNLESGRTRITTNLAWLQSGALTLGDRVEVFRRALETIRTNVPTFFSASTEAWLGSRTNIVSAEGSGNLTFLDGSSLGSRITRVPAGISPDTSQAELQAALLANRDTFWDDQPDTLQLTGLRRATSRPSDKHSAQLKFTREMTPWLRLTGSYTYMVNDLTSPAVINASRFTVLPRTRPGGCTATNCNPNSPSPFQQSVSVAFPVYGELDRYATNIVRRANLGASAVLPRNWVLSLDLSHTHNNSRTYGVAQLSSAAVTDAINNGSLNPFVDTREYPIELLDPDTPLSLYQLSISDYHGVVLHGQGPVTGLPWGLVPMLRVELQHERNMPADVSDLFGFRYGMRTTANSAAADVVVPLVRGAGSTLLRGLDLQLDYRVDQFDRETGTRGYSINQTTGALTYTGPTLGGLPYRDHVVETAPSRTFGLKYRPVDSLTLRASIGTAFQPPTAAQLTPNIVDPELDPPNVTVNDPARANAPVSVNQLTGGNPGLLPETSRSTSAGIIWQPRGMLEGLRLNAEYFDTTRKNAISTLAAQYIVDNEVMYPDRVIRDDSGAITTVNVTNLNLLSRSNSAATFTGEYSANVNGHFLSARGEHTRIFHVRTQTAVNRPEIEAVSYPHEGGAVQDKSSLNLRWRRNGFTAGWTMTRLGSYHVKGAAGGPRSMANAAAPGTPTQPDRNLYLNPQGSDTVPAQLIHDLVLGYSNRNSVSRVPVLFEDVTLTLGVRNVFNREPPMDTSYTGNFYINGWDRMRMRSFWLNMSKEFGGRP